MTSLHVSRFATLAEAHQYYARELDLFASDVRRRFAWGDFIDEEYQLAREEAEAYAGAGYSGTVGDAVQAWADAAGMTAQQAAADILATRDVYESALKAVRRHRLVGKAQINAETTIRSAYDRFIEYRGYLDAIQPPQ